MSFEIKKYVQKLSAKTSRNVVKIKRPLSGWVKDKEIGANLSISPDLFTTMVIWFNDGSGNEISGYAHVDEDAFVDWIIWTDEGKAGHVDNLAKNEVAAQVDAEKDGLYINVQWHTHPMMGVFWSVTDEKQQFERLEMTGVDNEIYFLVFDGVYWLTRRVVKSNDGIRYNDGSMKIEESNDSLPVKKIANHEYGYSSNDYWGNYFNDDENCSLPFFFGATSKPKNAIDDVAIFLVESFDDGTLENSESVIKDLCEKGGFIQYFDLIDKINVARSDVGEAIEEKFGDFAIKIFNKDEWE